MKTKTVRMMCAIQENSHSDKQIRIIESRANSLYKRHFGEQYKVIPIWLVIPRGQAYIAGEPSKASTVTLSVEDGTDNIVRHPFMSEFCEMWMEVTQCSENEIILNTTDKSSSDEVTEKGIDRINPATRKFHLAKQLAKIVTSKLVKGYYSMNMNFNR